VGARAAVKPDDLPCAVDVFGRRKECAGQVDPGEGVSGICRSPGGEKDRGENGSDGEKGRDFGTPALT
jgi:hypothetical protein